MNSSQNSETTLLLQHNVKRFEKYGFKFEFGVCTESRPEWIRVYRDTEGKVLSEEELNKLAEELNGTEDKRRISVDWKLSGQRVELSYVEFVKFSDTEGNTAKPICVYATTDGPLMAIQEDSNEEGYDLLDPCVVIYDGKGKINLLPIFNVGRKLRVSKHSVRNVQAPSEILVGIYPGFILQNRMYKYQLKPKVSFASSPELTNEAEAQNS